MALKLTLKKVFFGKEVEYKDTYLRINSFNGDKDGVTIQASIYTDSTKETEIEKLPNYYCNIDIEKPILKQCYKYLKDREEYLKSEDC